MDEEQTSFMDTSISDCHRRCFANFVQVLSNLKSPSHLYQQDISFPHVSNEFDRYKLWCGNVGAAHSGLTYRTSLDYRLREASSHKKLVVDVLNRLVETLERTTSLLKGESQPFESQVSFDDETESLSNPDSYKTVEEENDLPEPELVLPRESDNFRQKLASIRGMAANIDLEAIPGGVRPTIDSRSLDKSQTHILEVPQLLETLRFTIDCLYRIPIRCLATFDGSRKLTTINLTYFEPFDKSHIEERCPAASAALKQKLQRMMSRRRQLLSYRAWHYENIKLVALSETKRMEWPIKANNFEQRKTTRPPASEKQSSKPSQVLKAITIDPADFPTFPADLLASDYVSVTESLPSTDPSLWTKTNKNYVPPRPKGLFSSNDFLCPYCFVICSVKSDEAWKRHVLRDLKPYICTFTDCDIEDYQFENRDDWYEHELQNHRIEWCCNLDDHSPYTCLSEFMLHLQEHHSNLQLSLEPPNIIQLFQRPIKRSLDICLLCSKPSENIKQHVSHHMEQLALYVLGGNNQEDSEDGSNASQSARRVDSSADLDSDDDSAGREYRQHFEISNFISPQDDTLGEQLTVPDIIEVPWAIPFNVSGTLNLTATIISFLNLASYLTERERLYPEFVTSSLTGMETFMHSPSGIQSILFQLDENMKKQNTLGCLSQIEKNIAVISDQALDLCRDLAKAYKEFGATSDVNLQKYIASFKSRLTPMLLKEFIAKLRDLRGRLQRDTLLPLSENLHVLDRIKPEGIWEHDSMAGELFDVLKRHGPEYLLGSPRYKLEHHALLFRSLFNKPNSPAEPLPLSFLFSVTDVSINWDFPQRYEPESNQWIPPIECGGFRTPPMDPKVLYRCTNFTELSEANNYVWTNGQWRNNGNSSDLVIYRAMSIFWCNPIFLTSTCDPTSRNMADEDEPHNRWWPLTFDLNGPVARVQEWAERSSLRGTGNQWVTDFGLTEVLRNTKQKHSSELAGNIGTIIGLIALSCPAERLSNALLIDRAWHNGIWHGHQQGFGRTADPRGVVVTIYLDKENPGSTSKILEAVERSGGPLIRAFD